MMKKYFCLFLSILLVLGFSFRAEGLAVYASDLEKEGMSSDESVNEDLKISQPKALCNVVGEKTYSIRLARYSCSCGNNEKIYYPFISESTLNHSPPLL